ncbi:hypothetical protein B5807_06595 [Epicoccum nigrum]|uniref:Uncharacterized protein n=1 Tax=Epicoccum nigrum TaxID=105696 RepID=A0A1Y2LVU8_EPING|nr:hypothetical protein B5807_06595 [Epicoccum nigrum]
MSRIKTEFLLTAEFIDDVNYMLDFISGWPKQLALGIMRSFRMDPENQDRNIGFVNLSNGRWGVRLINPATRSSDASYQLPGLYTRKDLPDICQEQGCDDGCPRKASFQELAADLKKFRKEQMEAKKFKRPLLPRRSDQRISPLPPVLPHSNDRTMLNRSDDASDSLHTASSMACPSSPRPINMTLPEDLTSPNPRLLPDNDQDQLKGPPSPRPGSMILPSDMTSVSPALFPDNAHSQVEKVKMSIKMLGGPRVLGQDTVNKWLEQATAQSIPLNARDSLSPEAFDEKMRHGSLESKLVHREKIPAGPNSIRAEELRLNFPLGDWDRTTIPRVGWHAARKKSRVEFFAARVPYQSKPDSVRARPKGKQHIAPNTIVKKVRFRPQYEKHPEEY